ncbi:MAG TPA: hypothetical protein VMT76_17845 [Puia sp.]|nr:hypothetical protein [Puia sp.]
MIKIITLAYKDALFSAQITDMVLAHVAIRTNSIEQLKEYYVKYVHGALTKNMSTIKSNLKVIP